MSDRVDDRAAARSALREFLTTRRARISPEESGLPLYGGRRRVQGLRREEVAMLAGMSTEYYTRLERGQANRTSTGIVDAVARALRLDNDEREHLNRLLDALTPEARKRRPVLSEDKIRPGVQLLLDSLSHLPAFVFNGRLDIVAANDLGRAIYAPIFQARHRPANVARFMFLDEGQSRAFWPHWDGMANDAVALLRTEAGLHPHDPRLIELVGQLATSSEEFRTRWAAHNVRSHKSGVKTLRHPLVGELRLPFEDFRVDAAPDQVLMAYTPEPGSAAHDAIQLLASWNAAPPDQITEAAQPEVEARSTEPTDK
jgi:transcriptional regulator with XRE-family HTH domain